MSFLRSTDQAETLLENQSQKSLENRFVKWDKGPTQDQDKIGSNYIKVIELKSESIQILKKNFVYIWFKLKRKLK